MKPNKPTYGAICATICGDAGMGKTTLAASFPNPVFIRAEDGMQSLGANAPDAFPVLNKFEDILPQLAWLLNEKHQFKTVVIDSVTALERMIIEYIISMDDKKPKSINQALGGYGAGFAAVAGQHQRIRTAAKKLNEKGINVVFLAHCDTETLDLPDSDPYQRWVLRMNKKSVAPYVDDVDLVGFIKLRTVTIGDDDRKKAVSDGTRVLVTYATAANISKNRFGISGDLLVEAGKNPLLKYIPSLRKPTPQVAVEPQTETVNEGE